MKKKYLDGSDIDKEWLLKYTYKYVYLEKEYNGYISLINIDEVKHKISVDYDSSETCLVDNGYKCVIYMPLDKNWCVSTFVNRENEIVEWYFDMTKENSVEDGKPYFVDLYLDIAVSSDGKVKILDEDELLDALDTGIINNSDYHLAKITCKQIMDEVIPNEKFMNDFFYEYLEKMSV